MTWRFDIYSLWKKIYVCVIIQWYKVARVYLFLKGYLMEILSSSIWMLLYIVQYHSDLCCHIQIEEQRESEITGQSLVCSWAIAVYPWVLKPEALCPNANTLVTRLMVLLIIRQPSSFPALVFILNYFKIIAFWLAFQICKFLTFWKL